MNPIDDTNFVHPAIETLLTVVGDAADDLRMFHDTLAKARISKAAPFPRIAVATANRIIKNLENVETDLRRMLTALGLPESPDVTK
jgi:hypothetical protein